MTSFETSVATDGVTIVRAIGHLDMVSAPQFKALVASIVMGDNAAIVIDLSEVEFVDSSGLGAIISGLRASRRSGSTFRIATPNEQVRAMLELTSIDQILPPYDTVDAALHDG